VSHLRPQPLKSRQLRERYRKARRRQFAKSFGLICLLIVLVALLFGFVMLWRGCQPPAPQTILDPHYRRQEQNPQFAQTIAELRLNPAPWFTVLDDERLYVALDRERTEPAYPILPVDTISAYIPGENQPLWEKQWQGGFSWFGICGDTLYGVAERLADSAAIELYSFSTSDGAFTKRLRLDGGRCAVTATDDTVVLGYYLPDGYRLAGYQPSDWAKSWGMRLPLEHLRVDSSQPSTLLLQRWEELTAYVVDNVLGMVDVTAGGKLLVEYPAESRILAATYDPNTDIAYVVYDTETATKRKLVAVPVRGGPPRELTGIVNLGSPPLLVAENGYVLIGYQTATEGSPLRGKVVCFHIQQHEALLTHSFPEGEVWDLAVLPQQSGCFIAALVAGTNAEGQPESPSWLYRIHAEQGNVDLVKRFRQPITYIAPFKEDCLVIMGNGDIMSFAAEGPGLFHLQRAAYPVASLALSPGLARIAVFSSTADYFAGAVNQPAHVIVFE